jgi:N6-adenosine-specific RNA methylase IME4
MTDPFSGLRRRYRAIVADPPWHFRARTTLQMSNWTSRRDAEKHYPVMGVDDIAALPVRDLAHPEGCHLFLWATGPCLPQAFEVMSAWGFKYSSVAFTWVKLRRAHNAMQLRLVSSIDSDFHVGLGLTTRKNTEFVLLGRRGSPKRVAKNVRELLLSPVREHSRKPDEMFDRVERYCVGPYLELFARERRDGWTAWGNEVGKFGKAGDAGGDRRGVAAAIRVRGDRRHAAAAPA